MSQPAIHSDGVRGTVLLNEPMSRHTTWRVGGPADRYFVPADREDLMAFLQSMATTEPIFMLGFGSNLLVRDGGVRGTVIATAKGLARIERLDASRVRVEAGAASAKLARFCAREGLAGAEFLAGIPGTIGGALAMNAGCFGSETWSLVEEVETIDRAGELHRRSPADYRIGYRRVEGPEGEWFISATMRLSPSADAGALAERIRLLLDKRGSTQPTQQPNAGSVFRNPPGDYAGRLIEASGLKGACEGGACVSEKHANFIVNAGGATATDIETLIQRVIALVEEKQGVRLHPEVRVVGEAGAVGGNV